MHHGVNISCLNFVNLHVYFVPLLSLRLTVFVHSVKLLVLCWICHLVELNTVHTGWCLVEFIPLP